MNRAHPSTPFRCQDGHPVWPLTGAGRRETWKHKRGRATGFCAAFTFYREHQISPELEIAILEGAP